jgi:hypothetical protein
MISSTTPSFEDRHRHGASAPASVASTWVLASENS